MHTIICKYIKKEALENHSNTSSFLYQPLEARPPIQNMLGINYSATAVGCSPFLCLAMIAVTNTLTPPTAIIIIS